MAKAGIMEQQTQQKARRGVQAAVKTSEKPVIEQAEEIRQAGIQISEKTPSSLFLFAALGSIVGSLVLYTMRKKDDAVFVGLWAPTFLTLGVFSNILGISRKKE